MRPARRFVILLAVGLALWLAWSEGVRDHVIPKRFAAVRAGEVYRSGRLTPASMREVVRTHGIRTIVDLGTFPADSPRERRIAASARLLGVDRLRLELSGDGTGNPNAYVKAVRIAMRPETHPVLIQCGAGTERTGVAIVMYRVIHEGVDLETALREARRFGHSDARNPHFQTVLDEWLEPVRRTILEDGGFIDGFPVPP